MTRIFAVLILALMLALPVGMVQAAERILSYDTRIQVQPDGSLNIVEWIEVRAEGRQIKRGIYRDFPVSYRVDKGPTKGLRVGIDLDIDHVTMNGRKVGWFVEDNGDYRRLYIGEKSRYLPNGTYSYAISYTVDRAILFEQAHDRLYWNVIGPDWRFPIDRASVALILPPGAAPEQLEAWMGPYGARGQSFTRQDVNNTIVIRAGRALNPREAMTVDLRFTRGILHRPTTADRITWFIKDNAGIFTGFMTLLLVVIYYIWAWHKAGKDPAEGTIIAQYAPPKGLSPASVRYIKRHFYDNRTLTAALISLAIKGHITIDVSEDPGILFASKSYRLIRPSYPEFPPKPLSAGEKALLNTLLPESGYFIELEQRNHRKLQRAREAHASRLASAHQDVHFRYNLNYVFGGMAISGAGMWLAGFLLGVINIWLIVAGILLLCLNGLFWWLMRAPTLEGRRLLDEVEGFERYLTIAEKDRMNFHNPPDKTLDLFEKYLPYAIALNVENEWSEQFADAIAAANVAESYGGRGYHPRWYSGSSSYGGISDIGGFSRSMSSGLQSAFSAAATSPSSSSGGGGFGGGGGGFSGGGFGGGGGGGW